MNFKAFVLIATAFVGVALLAPARTHALYEPTKQATCPVGATNVTIGGYTYCSFEVIKPELINTYAARDWAALHNAQLICRYVNPYAIVISTSAPIYFASPYNNYYVYVDPNTGEFKKVWAANPYNDDMNVGSGYTSIYCGIPTVTPAQQTGVAISSQYGSIGIASGDTISNVIEGDLTLGASTTPTTLSLVSIRNSQGDNLVGSSTQTAFTVNPSGYFSTNPISISSTTNPLSTITIATQPSIPNGKYTVTVGATYTTTTGSGYTPQYYCETRTQNFTMPPGENFEGMRSRTTWTVACDPQSALALSNAQNFSYSTNSYDSYAGITFGETASEANQLASYEISYARQALANEKCGLGQWTTNASGFICNYTAALSTQTSFDFFVDQFDLEVTASCDVDLAQMTFNRYPGAVAYQIYKRQEGGATVQIATVADPGSGTQVLTTASSTLINGSAPGTPIYYQVKAFANGLEIGSSREYTYLGAGTTKPSGQCLSCTLGASPNPIQAGQSSTLSWSTSNEVGPTACTLRDITGNTVLSSSTTPPGTLSVSPASTRQYGLYCKDSVASGQCTSNVSVTVNPVTPAPSCTSFTATPNTLPPGGGNVNFAWNIANGQGPFTLTFSPASGFPTSQPSNGAGSQSKNVTTSTTFLLTITDALSRSATCSNATVTVNSAVADVPCVPTSDSPVIIPGGSTYPPNGNGYIFGTNAPTTGNNTFMYNASPSTKCEYRCDTAGGYQSVGRSATGKRCVKTQDFGER